MGGVIMIDNTEILNFTQINGIIMTSVYLSYFLIPTLIAFYIAHRIHRSKLKRKLHNEIEKQNKINEKRATELADKQFKNTVEQNIKSEIYKRNESLAIQFDDNGEIIK